MNIHDEMLRLLRQLDAACINRDLPAARRIAYRMAEITPPPPCMDPDHEDGCTCMDNAPREPVDVTRVKTVVAMYASRIWGWNIEKEPR